LAEVAPAPLELHEERVLLQGLAGPSEVEEDDEISEIFLREFLPLRLAAERSRRAPPAEELGEARKRLDQPAHVRGEEDVEEEVLGRRVPGRGLLLRDREERVAPVLRRELELIEERRHEVHRVRNALLGAQHRGEVEVVLQRVQAHPGQPGPFRVDRQVPGLVQVPEEDEAYRTIRHVAEERSPSMSPGDPRRTTRSPECCFLPDLTRCGGGRRAGPELIEGPRNRGLWISYSAGRELALRPSGPQVASQDLRRRRRPGGDRPRAVERRLAGP